MEARFITPFIQSVQNVFSTMLQLPMQIGEPRVKAGKNTGYDVSGIIGMSGDVVGSVVLSFPDDAAKRVVALFAGEELGTDSPDFADAIGELVNMVAGGAKANFDGAKVSISCPSVVVGSGHLIANTSDVPVIEIPCMTDCGEVAIQIAIKTNANAPTQAASASA
ncbi:MAG: chemotaxis protein CheX [Phycisphaerales bacterium]|nr:chemotaxis protein CheX [Phycisphaerales bacterium]